MNGRNGPLSPVSLGGSDWSSRPPIDRKGSYTDNRGQLISPPNSAGSAGVMNGGYQSGPRSVGGPSPPPSVGRSSAGTNLYPRSDSRRSDREEATEAILGEHYVSLKRFLNGSSQGKPNAPPNKARDKLQRLTGVQFLELSTDVYDELKRREAVARRPPTGNPNQDPPLYLLPEDTFHPKRNQARQKLSSLGPPRFRDLATDVFCELERRYPRFAVGDIPRLGSPLSVRGPPSRSQTPVNGGMNGYGPRGPSRVRRPSEASSIRSVRVAPGGPNGYGPPPSPGAPNGNFERPMAKQFQQNTIVPNKSTMVEEDDDIVSPISPRNDLSPRNDSPNTFKLDAMMNGNSRDADRRDAQSEADKKMIEDYEAKVSDLQDRLDAMEDQMKRKDDELNNVLDGERNRATAANLEKKEWDDLRLNLENKLDEAQALNDSLQQQLEQLRDDHADETRQLRDDMNNMQQNMQQQSRGMMGNGAANENLQRENQELRVALQEQQEVTNEVRREAQEFLREMKMLSQQSGSTWEKQSEMEKTIEELEREVRDWRNRYARTKTQLRNMRASSMGLTIEQDAAKYVREKGFTRDNGLVKDVHVTKFQISIDELLRIARANDPEKVIDGMKAVVVSVRQITKDIDNSAPNDDDLIQQQAKLKARVSSTANNLITASKNFAASAGISPVSLLDAAASHLVAAVVELLRTVKIRATPAGELEDDDDGTITPVDSTGFFSPRSNGQSQVSSATSTQSATYTQNSTLQKPPPFQGLGGNRDSADSSAYSPISSPRESYSSRPPASPPRAMDNGYGNGNSGYPGMSKGLPSAPNGFGRGMAGGGLQQQQQQDSRRAEEVKIYLEDQTAVLVQTIQKLVELIRPEPDSGRMRAEADAARIRLEIRGIADIIGRVMGEAETLPAAADLVARLAGERQRLLEAGDRGRDGPGGEKKPGSYEWRMWTQTLPPIAFKIARETKELVQCVDRLAAGDGGSDGGGADEFA